VLLLTVQAGAKHHLSSCSPLSAALYVNLSVAAHAARQEEPSICTLPKAALLSTLTHRFFS
jgi:hypothetical protein